MIVRDNERTIGTALEVIRKYGDVIVVVDTSSTDRTPEIAATLRLVRRLFRRRNERSGTRSVGASSGWTPMT